VKSVLILTAGYGEGHNAAARHLQKLIEENEPEVIVSTYPGCNHLLDWIFRKRLKRPFRTVTVITDSLTVNPVWYRAHSDAHALPVSKPEAFFPCDQPFPGSPCS